MDSNFTIDAIMSRDHIIELIGHMDDLNVGRIEGFITCLAAIKEGH